MKVHLHQIPDGATLHLEGTQDSAFIGLEEAGATPVGPLEYSLDAGLSEGGIFATGSLRQRVRLRCVACLEDFETDIEIPDFALQKELTTREQVDFSDEVREDIQLALPAYPRCDAEGRKTCPASFPPVPANSSPSSGTPAWNALDKLKTDN